MFDNKPLIVSGYQCAFSLYGFSGSQVNIYKKKSFFGMFSYWGHVYTAECTGFILDYERATAERLRQMYQDVVDKYEIYKTSWDKENDKLL